MAAMQSLVYCYENGIGVKKSMGEAKKWNKKIKELKANG